jgi:hypothetical protein
VGLDLLYEVYTSTLRHTTHGKVPLEELETRRRDLYLTTQNTHKRQTSMLPAGFEHAIPTIERLKTHVLARAANYNLSNSKSQFCSQQVNIFFPSLRSRKILGHPSQKQLIRNCSDVFFPEGKSASP